MCDIPGLCDDFLLFIDVYYVFPTKLIWNTLQSNPYLNLTKSI